MLEFITQDTKLCPYCKSELKVGGIGEVDCWKVCSICKKHFEIAEFTQRTIDLLKEKYNDE